jgi:hypothetical protein
MLKENLGIKPQPIGFLVKKTGVEFGEPPQKKKKETAPDRAMLFLRKRMKLDQQVKSADLIEEAHQEGISVTALHIARTKLGVKTTKTKEGWMWLLPSVLDETRILPGAEVKRQILTS